MKSFSRNLSHS